MEVNLFLQTDIIDYSIMFLFKKMEALETSLPKNVQVRDIDVSLDRGSLFG